MPTIRLTLARCVASILVAAAVVLVPSASALGAALVSGQPRPAAPHHSPFSGAPDLSLPGDGLSVRIRAAALRRVLQAHPASQRIASRPGPAVLVRISHDLAVTSKPGGGRTIGIMPARSKYLGTPTTAWVLQVSADGRFGMVSVPYRAGGETGWIRLAGLARSTTRFLVRVDLSKHQLMLLQLGRVIMRVPAGTGAPWSPTPPGRYFVTDLVPVHVGSAFGSFAFGLSGIQPNLPRGWTGGNQLAIHGTNRPSTIGASASAGCLHVSEATLARLRHLLKLGTPVIIGR